MVPEKSQLQAFVQPSDNPRYKSGASHFLPEIHVLHILEPIYPAHRFLKELQRRISDISLPVCQEEVLVDPVVFLLLRPDFWSEEELLHRGK